jgi:hypothetical protein
VCTPRAYEPKNVLSGICPSFFCAYHMPWCSNDEDTVRVTTDGVLDWWPDLLDSLIQRVTTLYNWLICTHTSVHRHVFTGRCSVAASNSGPSPSSGSPNCPRASATSSHSNSSQGLNRIANSPNNYYSIEWLPGWRPSHSNLLLFSLPSQDSSLTAAVPRYIASARTVQKTPLPTALPLLRASVAALT